MLCLVHFWVANFAVGNVMDAKKGVGNFADLWCVRLCGLGGAEPEEPQEPHTTHRRPICLSAGDEGPIRLRS